MDNPLHDRQADAGPLVVFDPMQTLKDPEELVGVAHVETDPVVFDEIDLFGRPLADPAADLDHGRLAFRAIFERIGDQVRPYLFEQRRIGVTCGQVAHSDFDPASVLLQFQLLQALPDDAAGGDLILFERLAAQP